MHPDDIVAKTFDRLIKRRQRSRNLGGFTPAERAIYLIVSVRRESDMGGFESVFEQCVDRPELRELIEHLRRMREMTVAEAFADCLGLLEAHGFYGKDGMASRGVSDLPSAVQKSFARAKKRIGEALWSLDSKLAALLPG